MKKERKGLPKVVLAIIQIGIVIAVVILFSVVNHYFIGFEPPKEKPNNHSDSEMKPVLQKEEQEPKVKEPEKNTENPPKNIEKKSKKKKTKEKKKKKSKKKDLKNEIVKINDKILADLLTPLPDGTTKVQLYAETLNSKLGPITYFNQSDYRWAKYKYGNSSYMYSSGCGPTIMAMAVNTFNTKSYVTPKEMADFAYSKGCYVKGGGSTHDIVKKCCEEYNIPVKVIFPNKENIETALNNNKLVVALVGKGEFTTGGHFILLTEIDDKGQLSIADSINLDNTHKKWDTEFIISQLKKSVSAGPLWEIG